MLGADHGDQFIGNLGVGHFNMAVFHLAETKLTASPNDRVSAGFGFRKLAQPAWRKPLVVDETGEADTANRENLTRPINCLLYTSDAADE